MVLRRVPLPAARIRPSSLLSLGAIHVQEIPETVESPLPGGLAAIVRWFFSVPQWIQIGGAILGGLVFLLLLLWMWRRRAAIKGWVLARERGVQAAMAAGALAIVLVMAAFGGAGWNYMQHDNDFCTGCHVMSDPFQRFIDSQHADLSCHDCHQQSIFASTWQLWLWVTERPEEIGEHSPVPNPICVACHVIDDPTETWERISATAGHRVHLESDSTVLADLMCVTCHGEEVHRFVPANETCGQSDCHAEEDTRIVLGSMAEQTGFHCITCHEFTARVSEIVAVDRARLELIPRVAQCFSCHDMETQLVSFDETTEPHGAVCGDCHNPHDQQTPAAAFTTCSASGCHERADTLTAFHRGLREGVLDDCAACHAAHEWIVEGEDCAACHADVPGAGTAGNTRAAAPEADARLAFRTTHLASVAVSRPPGLRSPSYASSLDRAASGVQEEAPFRHEDHSSVKCGDCHASSASHGAVTIRTEADCLACHHGAASSRLTCESCHVADDLAGTLSVSSELAFGVWPEPGERELPFEHGAHGEVKCAECHAVGLGLAAEDNCGSCHVEHHSAAAACEVCHLQPPGGAHTIEVHEGTCTGSGCHADAGEYEAVPSTRSFCLSCHQDLWDHEPADGCVRCHLVPEGHAASPLPGSRSVREVGR